MTTSQHITISVNGEMRQVPAGASLLDLLAELGIGSDTRGVAVAVGDHVVRRADWSTTALADGAHVEVVTAVQGG